MARLARRETRLESRLSGPRTVLASPGKGDKVSILGIRVDASSLTLAANRILAWAMHGTERSYVCVTGVHGIMESQRSADLRDIHNNAGIVTTDGMPLVYICRFAGHEEADRVYGPDLMLRVCEASAGTGIRHFFYGTTADTLGRLSSRLLERFPGLEIAGSHAPPFGSLSDAELGEAIDKINRSKPDIVWVALGTPKQERWMAANRPRLNAPVLIGVGAAFDFHAGTVAQAPSWMQPLCLEWLYRLYTEPRRLWKRYLLNNPQFLILMAAQTLGLRRF